MTPQRKLILETLRQSGGMLDAKELFKKVNRRDDNISMATVYRALNVFKQAGLIDEHHLSRSACCYEIKQSPQRQHLYCRCCEKIIDFDSPAIMQMLGQIEKERGFVVEKFEVCIQGTCRECRQIPHSEAGINQKEETK